MRRSFWALLTGTFLTGTVAIAACAPVESQRGYVPDQNAISSIEVGVDTKDMVSKKLGDPSTAATFGGDEKRSATKRLRSKPGLARSS